MFDNDVDDDDDDDSTLFPIPLNNPGAENVRRNDASARALVSSASWDEFKEQFREIKRLPCACRRVRMMRATEHHRVEHVGSVLCVLMKCG